MIPDFRNLDIAKNVKMIEGLKADLLGHVSALFRGFVRGSESVLIDCLANIIVSTYALSRRLGISYAELDKHVIDKTSESVPGGYPIDDVYEDLTELRAHLIRKK